MVATGASVLLAGILSLLAGVELRESVRSGQATRCRIDLKAEGELHPAHPGGEPAKPVPLNVESRLEFVERLTGVGSSSGLPRRAVRKTDLAQVSIQSAARPMTTRLRTDRALLIADRLRQGIRCYSPSGPLTRPELDIVQTAADPLYWAELLPEKPVAIGDTWDIRPEAARALSDYEVLASSTLRAKVESLDDASAGIRLAGQVRGATRGAEGTITIDGTFTFNRVDQRIERLDLTRTESRKPGPIEPGFTFKGTLTARRSPVAIPPELTDSAISALPSEPSPHLLLLQFEAPDGKYRLLHDRDWHLFWDDVRLAVLKRIDHGDLLAQCNLSVGPSAGKGRHQDPGQFREDIRRALGSRFVAVLGEGEIESAGPGDFRYRVVVQGKEADQAILWYYYLIASPEGDQLLATFALNASDQKRFDDQDLQMIGSLEWKPAVSTPPSP